MTAHSDDLIRAFLAEGRDELPDRAFDAVRGEIHQTRQRVVIGPWRQPHMSNLTRVALVAAAVVAVVIGAIRLLPTTSGPGGPLPSVAPSPSPSATPSGSAAPSAALLTPGTLCTNSCRVGSLEPGTYTLEPSVSGTPVTMSFTVPAAGWSVDGGGFVTKHAGEPGEVFFTSWVVSHVFSDVCAWVGESKLVAAGTTSAQLAAALTAQKNRVVSPTTDITLGGFPAKRIELTQPAGLDTSTCTDGNLRAWPDPGPDMGGGMCCFPKDSIDDLSIADVNGKRSVIIARHQPGSSAADVAELNAIVDSVRFGTSGGSPAP
jgi:hypothetical protein